MTETNAVNQNTIANPAGWLTSEEAASYLQIEPRTLQAWARAGKVKGHILSGIKRHVWRFRLADLDAMLVPPAVLAESEG